MKTIGVTPTCVLLVAMATGFTTVPASSPESSFVAALHTYEARFRFEGKLSVTQVKASDGGHAKRLVQQQFPKATVLSIKRID